MTSLWLDSARSVTTLPFSARARFDDIVIGAGLTGLSTALMLAQAGRSVAVVEAREPGALSTGSSTAKVSLLQGTRLSTIARRHSDRVVTAYALANLEGQAWLLELCRRLGVAVEAKSAVTYAGSPDAAASVHAEYTVARRIGLNVTHETAVNLPYPTFGAVVMPDQFQLNPMDLVAALLAELQRLGVPVVSGVTVTGVKAGSTCRIATSTGEIESHNVVLATGTPFLDRGLYFAKTSVKRSLAMAFRYDGDAPEGMFLSADAPTRSLRTATVDGDHYLLVGGNGYVTGRHPSPASLVDDLEKWTLERFAGARRTHSWSAQDYSSDNEIPFVGLLPRGHGRVWFATGFDKWGMTNGPAAGLRISAEILGTEPQRWVKVLGRRLTVPADLAEGVIEGVAVAKEVAKGVRADHVVEAAGCRLSAVCPHLGGIVSWNDAERSWDCPLHGSRFSATGERLEGPATTGLKGL